MAGCVEELRLQGNHQGEQSSEDPQLKTCPFWDRAVFLGMISYKTPVANYDGGIVKYDGRIYYVNRSQIEALRPYVRWNLRSKISVIED